jgi:WD40 repeat protein
LTRNDPVAFTGVVLDAHASHANPPQNRLTSDSGSGATTARSGHAGDVNVNANGSSSGGGGKVDMRTSTIPTPSARDTSSGRKRSGQTPRVIRFAVPEFDLIGELADSQPIRAVAFSPSGSLLAVGSNSSTLRVCPVDFSDRDHRDHHHHHHRDSDEMGEQAWPPSSGGARGAVSHAPTALPVAWRSEGHHGGSIYCVGWNTSGELRIVLLATAAQVKFC